MAAEETVELLFTADYAKAKAFFERGVAGKAHGALIGLAHMAHFAQGGPPDYVKARGYYQRAVKAGRADGHTGLGRLLRGGLGVGVVGGFVKPPYPGGVETAVKILVVQRRVENRAVRVPGVHPGGQGKARVSAGNGRVRHGDLVHHLLARRRLLRHGVLLHHHICIADRSADVVGRAQPVRQAACGSSPP